MRSNDCRHTIDQSHDDRLVHCARDTADTVVTAAREKTDHGPPHAAHGGPSAALVEERRVEDDARQQERATAEEGRRRERAEHARAVSRLLPQERDKTDRDLSTERNRSDEAIAHRDDFLGIVSHDLRNLVTAIMIAAQRMTTPDAGHEAGDPTIARDVATNIKRYAARMKRLIGDIEDVANLNAGHLPFTPARGDARRLIIEAAQTLQTAATAKGISLENRSPRSAAVGRVRHGSAASSARESHWECDQIHRGGWSYLGCVARGSGTTSDSPSATPGQVCPPTCWTPFERFWQVGNDDRRGSGLGLYICKRLVEAHGGRTWAESTMGEGSTFYVTLPAVT